VLVALVLHVHELTGSGVAVSALFAATLVPAALAAPLVGLVADRLVISPKTAEHHVGRILRKLGLRSRAEAAAHAVRTELKGV